ncbi:MAG: hypothetical protein JXR84_12130 [Anaerolineae bacterium]|nr:hypothetical protein [Anaerolineae bacterium]
MPANEAGFLLDDDLLDEEAALGRFCAVLERFLDAVLFLDFDMIPPHLGLIGL